MDEYVSVVTELMKTTDANTAILIALAGSAVAGGRKLLKMLPGIIENVMDKYQEKHKKPDVALMLALDMELRDLMNSMIRVLGCSRALIFQYHNGDKLFSGQHYLKASCMHEFTNVKASKIPLAQVQKDYVNVPISFFDFFIKNFKDSQVFCTDIDAKTHKTNPVLYDFFNRHKVTSVIGAELKDNDNYPYGFMMFEFHNKDDNRQINKLTDSIEDLSIKAGAILESMAIVQEQREK